MSTETCLSAIFRACRPDDDENSSDDNALEAALRGYVDAARASWPDFGIEAAQLVRYVASRAPRGQLPAATHAGDVLLACACSQGVPAAIESFHRHYRVIIARVLSRRRATDDIADDTIQIVFQRLLVAPTADGVPKISEYKGSGPLRSWVSTAAATTLLMMRRAAGRRREQADESGLYAGLATNADPELLYLKERCKADMEEAIVRALARLSDRERTLLRLHLSESMTIDELGIMYKVNRATAARWLAAARESVVAGARDDLRARLHLSDSECNSIVALVQSELHVSIGRRLS